MDARAAKAWSGLLLAGAALLPLSFAATARADGMRCGTQLVSEGDSTYQVRQRCGAPDQAVTRIEHRTYSRWIELPCVQNGVQTRCGQLISETIPVQVDEWLYDFGPHQLIRTLTFEVGRLIRLETGGYGVEQS